MKIGPMRHRVRIERSTDEVDAHGQPVRTWGLVAEVWADVQPITGRELIQADKIEGQVSHRVWGRWCDCREVKPSDRIVTTFGTLGITAVINREQRNRTLEMLCLQEV